MTVNYKNKLSPKYIINFPSFLLIGIPPIIFRSLKVFLELLLIFHISQHTRKIFENFDLPLNSAQLSLGCAEFHHSSSLPLSIVVALNEIAAFRI